MTNAANQVKSDMMKAAWTLAKNAAKKFGGKASDYISEAMKKMWETAKGTAKIHVSKVKDQTEFAEFLGLGHLVSYGQRVDHWYVSFYKMAQAAKLGMFVKNS